MVQPFAILCLSVCACLSRHSIDNKKHRGKQKGEHNVNQHNTVMQHPLPPRCPCPQSSPPPMLSGRLLDVTCTTISLVCSFYPRILSFASVLEASRGLGRKEHCILHIPNPRMHPKNAHGEEDHAEDFKRGREGQVAEEVRPIHYEVVREALHTCPVLCVTTCLSLQNFTPES